MGPDRDATSRWLEEHRAEVLRAWRALILGRPASAAAALLRPDPFANPAGHRLHQSTSALLDALAAGGAEAALREAIEPLIRVQAIQGARASEAVGFVPLLGRACAAVAGGMPAEQASALRDRLEGVLLVAFDVYTRCREDVFEIRVREARRRVSVLLDRFAMQAEAGEAPPGSDPAGNA